LTEQKAGSPDISWEKMPWFTVDVPQKNNPLMHFLGVFIGRRDGGFSLGTSSN